MPRGDGTGPAGMGPMTGRAAGHCAGYGVPGFMNRGGGRGFGCGHGWGGGRGGGHGWRHGFYATGLPGWARMGTGVVPPPAPEAEKRLLEAQVELLQDQLEQVKKRMEELAAEKPQGK